MPGCAQHQLDPGGTWEKTYQFLKKEDIKTALRSETTTGKGYILVQQSWIWGRRDAALDGRSVKRASGNDMGEGGLAIAEETESE